MPATTVNADVAPLFSILSKEQRIYQQLLEVAEGERQAIITGSLLDLRAALERKQDILARLGVLEDHRMVWLQRFAAQKGIEAEALTLSTVAESCAAPEAKLLRQLQRKLRKGIHDLVQLNAVTKATLEKIVQSIDVAVNYLMADDGASQVYGAHGQLQAAPAVNRQLLEYQA